MGKLLLVHNHLRILWEKSSMIPNQRRSLIRSLITTSSDKSTCSIHQRPPPTRQFRMYWTSKWMMTLCSRFNNRQNQKLAQEVKETPFKITPKLWFATMQIKSTKRAKRMDQIVKLRRKVIPIRKVKCSSLPISRLAKLYTRTIKRKKDTAWTMIQIKYL